MNKNAKIKVKNRSASSLSYIIPDMNNFRRRFAAGETKEIPFEEVQKLTYMPGGDYMLQHYLVIENIEARDEILGSVELEYDYTDKEVKNLLVNGSIDQLLDCLDFAPLGVIDLVKKIATEIELNDIKKREVIFKKTGYNINNAIAVNKETDETVEDKKPESRRVSAENAVTSAPTTASQRRVSNYTVTKK